METCGHLGPKFRVRDRQGDGTATISCSDCIADELETLSVGTIEEWEIERLSSDGPICRVWES